MLSCRRRLKRGDFILLKKNPRKVFSSNNFSLKVYSGNFNPSRFSVIVGSKVIKKATERNKAKRRIKAVIINYLGFFKDNLAVLIYLKKDSFNNTSSFRKIEEELFGLFKKSNILRND